jgi:hypothetical protein
MQPTDAVLAGHYLLYFDGRVQTTDANVIFGGPNLNKYLVVVPTRFDATVHTPIPGPPYISSPPR